MDSNMDLAVSLSQAVSASALQYLQELKIKSELRKTSESRNATVEDIVELTAAAQAELSERQA
jgi:hypothetical protein